MNKTLFWTTLHRELLIYILYIITFILHKTGTKQLDVTSILYHSDY